MTDRPRELILGSGVAGRPRDFQQPDADLRDLAERLTVALNEHEPSWGCRHSTADVTQALVFEVDSWRLRH